MPSLSAHRSIDDYTGLPATDEFADTADGEDDEIDETADPFVILARKEERAGVPLHFVSFEVDLHD